LDAFGHVRLRRDRRKCSAGRSKRSRTSRAARSCSAHIQRGGSPSAYDRVLGTRYGVKAVELAITRRIRENGCVARPDVVGVDFDSVISEVVDKKTGKSQLPRAQPLCVKELYDVAKVFFG